MIIGRLITAGIVVRRFAGRNDMTNEEAKMQIQATDTISRQAAIDAVEHITSSMSVCVNTDECHGMKRMQRQAVIELANLTSAQPELKTVKCIIGGGYMDIGDADFSMKCAKCGAEYYHVENYDYDYNFCPNCGRRWRRQDG